MNSKEKFKMNCMTKKNACKNTKKRESMKIDSRCKRRWFEDTKDDLKTGMGGKGLTLR